MGAFLKVREVSQRLGVSAQTVYALCSRGLLPHVRVGVGRGSIRVGEEALAAYLVTAARGPHSREVVAPPARLPRLRHLKA